MKCQLEGKKILITGGTGTIGKAMALKVLEQQPAVLRILDVDETREFEMRKELAAYSNVRFLLGDIRDKERLSRAIENIDIVFHLASLKHVPACEYNPMEAAKTNVIGTQNLIEVALQEEVDRMIFTSSDKAVNPCNVLGATKLLAEKLITAGNYYRGSRKTIFSSVRFGNVMGSRGSIVPLFKEQVRKGDPVTITDEKMTRFVMSINQATELLLRSTAMAQGGEVFVAKMKSARILDLANIVIGSNNPKTPKINIIGRGPGEKLFEELMTESESERALETSDTFIITPEISEFLEKPYNYPGAKPAAIGAYRSDNAEILTKQELLAFCKKENIL